MQYFSTQLKSTENSNWYSLANLVRLLTNFFVFSGKNTRVLREDEAGTESK